MINNPKLLWLIPPVCGIISATFIYGLIFIGVADDSVGLVRFLEGTFTWVLWLIDMLNIGPHGCEGMIWLGLAPGIAWFLFGAVLGAIWAFVIFQRLRRSGQMPPRIDYREVAAEIQARPDYDNFIQEDPKRRYLYYEQLPLEFDKWLQQRRDTKPDANKSCMSTTHNLIKFNSNSPQ